MLDPEAADTASSSPISSCSSTWSPGTPLVPAPMRTTSAARMCTCGACSDTSRNWISQQLAKQQGRRAAAIAAGQGADIPCTVNSSSGKAVIAGVPAPAFVLLGVL
jgi:hypothetical protein